VIDVATQRHLQFLHVVLGGQVLDEPVRHDGDGGKVKVYGRTGDPDFYCTATA
jgi:hypothetical protein